jgi:hypothetical protein
MKKVANNIQNTGDFKSRNVPARHDRRVIGRRRRRAPGPVTERAQADIAWPVAHDEQDQERRNAA